MEFKKIISSAAAFCMGMSSFAGLAAVNVFAEDNSLSITRQTGWFDSAYITWTNPVAVDSYNVYVKPEGGSYTKLDAELTRYYGSYYRADALGLAAGNYQMAVGAVVGGAEQALVESGTLTVVPYVREGFAFDSHSSNYNPDGVGAYKNDGTLKNGAKVVYITDANKDTVQFDVVTDSSKGTVTTCIGLGEILSAREKNKAETTPLAIRMIGQVESPAGKNSTGYMQIKSTENITFEGVGDDATTYHWSFLVREAKNVEIRNLAVMEFYDDGISLDTKNYNCWVHNCDIFYGQNRGGDQTKGDGSLDVKSGSDYCTFSYNHFWDSGKTSLCGMKSDNNQGYHMTYYGNWFDHSDSRHPRVRGDQVHVYNNYYDGVSKYGAGACTGGSVYVEKNVFRNTKWPVLTSQQGSDIAGGAKGTFSGEEGGSIKMYDNAIYGGNSLVYASESNTSDYDAYLAKTRDEQVPSTYTALKGGATYSNFDTASTMYSYNALDTDKVVDTVQLYAGRVQGGDFTHEFNDAVDDALYERDSVLGDALQDYVTTLNTEYATGTSYPATSGTQPTAKPTTAPTATPTVTAVPTVTAAPEVTIDNDYSGGTKTVETFGVDVNHMLSNITVGNDTIRGPKLSVLGHDFYLFELDGKASFSLGRVKIEAKFDAEKNTIKLVGGYDFKKESVSTGTDYTSREEYNKAYNDLKSLYNALNGGTLGGQAVRSKYNSVYRFLKEQDSNLLMNIKGNFALYGELGLENGNPKLIEGGIIVKASASGSIDPHIGGIFYGTLGLTLDASGNFAVKFDGVKKPLAVDAKLKVEPAVNIGIGAGSKKVKFYAEGGFKGKLPIEMLAVTGSFDTGASFTPLKVYLQGFLYVSAKAVVFGYDNEWQLGSDFILYPRNGDAALSSFEELYAVNKGDLVMLPRDYAEYASLMELSDEFDKQNLYPYSTPKLAALADGRYILLWIDDDPSKADADRTSLYYSIYSPDDELWSAPQIAVENEGYNEMPQICVSGDKVHIVWTRIDETLGDRSDIDTMLSKLDLYYTCFDGENFSEPVLVSESENGLCEILYSVSEENGKVTAVWAENSENDLALSEGINRIYKRTIGSDGMGNIEMTAEDARELHDLEQDNYGNVIYEIGEGDNSIIYRNGYQIGESSNDNSSFNIVGNNIYYLSATELIEYNILSSEELRTEIGEITDIKIFENGDKKTALSLVSKGFANELYQNEYKDGAWGEWTQLTNYGRYIRDYSAVLENGELTIALNLVEVKDEEKGGYGSAELVVAKDCVYSDIILDDAPFYDGDVIENETVNIGFNVTNNSRNELNSIHADITDASGKTMYSGDISCDIKAGETAQLFAPITIPQGFIKQDITVSIPEIFDGEDMSNNSASLTIGYADAALENIRIEGSGKNAVLKGTVKNVGFERADNLSLVVYDSDASGKILMSMAEARLVPGEEDEFSMPLPEQYQNYSLGKRAIYFELSMESEEVEFGNNTDRLILADLSEAVNEYSMSYDDNVLTIKSPRAQGAILAAAYYDEEGRLTDCHIVELALGIGTNSISTDGLVSGANACFMLWSEDYEPLCDSLTW